MGSKIKLCLLALILLAQINPAESSKRNNQDDLIEIPLTPRKTLEDSPKTILVDSPRNHRPSSQDPTSSLILPNDDAPIANKFAYCCGKFQRCHTRIYEIDEKTDRYPHCCSNVCYGCTGCISMGGIATTLIQEYPAWSAGSMKFIPFTPWIPGIVGGCTCLVCTYHTICGMYVLNCGECVDKKNFRKDFTRGLTDVSGSSILSKIFCCQWF